MEEHPKSVVVKSNINIALVKYWGKLSAEFNLPLNCSLSVTLADDLIFTQTRVTHTPLAAESQFVLQDAQGKEVDQQFPKGWKVIEQFFRQYAEESGSKIAENFRFLVESANSFPTKAGMASSASGICALVVAMARMVDFFGETENESGQDIFQNIDGWVQTRRSDRLSKVLALAVLCRVCCGSASRSLYSGLCLHKGPLYNEGEVGDPEWEALFRFCPAELGEAGRIVDRFLKTQQKVADAGLFLSFPQEIQEKIKKIDPKTSHHEFLALPVPQFRGISGAKAASFFEGLRVTVFVLDGKQKETGSTQGMTQTILTSTLFPQRLVGVEKTILRILEAIFGFDYQEFFELLMRESNNMHAVMLDTFPPLQYLNDQSRAVMNWVHSHNRAVGVTACGYTFDAGCNPFIFSRTADTPHIVAELQKLTGVASSQIYVTRVKQG